MVFKTKLVFILLFLLFLNIAVASANDMNMTEISYNSTFDENKHSLTENTSDSNQSEKTAPIITISSESVNARGTLEISLKNSTDHPLISKKLNATINNKLYSIKTDSNGVSKLKINLNEGTYKLSIFFDGDDNYTSLSKTFNIKVLKLKTHFVESANFVVNGKYLFFSLIDSDGNAVSHKKIIIKYNGKKYTKKTKSNGKVKLKIKSSKSKHSIKINFKGDKQFKSSSKKLKIHVTTSRSITIGNSKLLTKGYLRVYLKQSGHAISKKVTLLIGGKKITKKANSEGIVIFKPRVGVNHYTVKAKVGRFYSAKSIKCYQGNVKDPLVEKIKYKNGKPDIDLMPKNYVMGDANAKYTLKKSQYREVLKRDSYCLFLNNKLTKYTFFKTKNHPKLNHIIKRQKWNVIERAVITKLVNKNKKNYWPGKITVLLKGKSYTYPEVRDVQNKGYTCGPTSASVCSQVLKNYVPEKYLSKLAGSKRGIGTSCPAMIKALSKNHFVCKYFYKSTFKSALKKVKNGGAALIFHANNHYVSIIDVSSNGKKVLVSNSYGTYDGIPTKWVKVSFMKKKFSKQWDESLIVKLKYKLSSSTKNKINCYYHSFGANWHKHNTHQSIGK